MSPLDGALGLLVVGSMLRSAHRGLLKDGAIYAGLVAGLLLAGCYNGLLVEALRLDAEDPSARLACYLGLLLLVLALASLASSLLQPLARLHPLWVVDRLGGVAVGAGQGLLLCGLLVATALNLSAELVAPHLAQSHIAPLAARLLAAVLEWVPDEIVTW